MALFIGVSPYFPSILVVIVSPRMYIEGYVINGKFFRQQIEKICIESYNWNVEVTNETKE